MENFFEDNNTQALLADDAKANHGERHDVMAVPLVLTSIPISISILILILSLSLTFNLNQNPDSNTNTKADTDSNTNTDTKSTSGPCLSLQIHSQPSHK